MHLVGHRQHCFRKKLQRFDMHAQLACVRDEEKSFDADEIAVIQKRESSPGVCRIQRVCRVVSEQSKVVLTTIDLKPRYSIREMYERRLTHHSRRNSKPARNANIAKLLQRGIQAVLYFSRRAFS